MSARAQVWSTLSPETKADIMRTRMIRWTAENPATLTPEQLQMLLEFCGFISADMYRSVSSAETDAWRGDFLSRAGKLFPTRTTWLDAFSLDGHYLPPSTPAP